MNIYTSSFILLILFNVHLNKNCTGTGQDFLFVRYFYTFSSCKYVSIVNWYKLHNARSVSVYLFISIKNNLQ